MTKIALALLLGNGLFVDNTGASDDQIWTYRYLLASAEAERELAPIAEHIIADWRLQTPAVFDVAAEVLLARMRDIDYPLKNKQQLIRILGVVGNQRYAAVLAQVGSTLALQEIQEELRKVSAKGTFPAAAYVPGTVDIKAIVNEVDAAALAATPTTEQGKHLSEFSGESIEELIRWAGKPQQIVSGETRVKEPVFFDIKIQRMTFFYRGLGRAVFGYLKGKKAWQFQAVVADPLAFEHEFSYRERAAELGLPDDATLEMTQLLSGYTAAMKLVVERNFRRDRRRYEFMDTAAEILATQFESAQDPVTIDMYAWICRLLAERGGKRYAAILEQVAKHAPDPKLARYASRPIDAAPRMPAEPYVPGTMSLALQRAKYPVLYPQSTFQSGRL